MEEFFLRIFIYFSYTLVSEYSNFSWNVKSSCSSQSYLLLASWFMGFFLRRVFRVFVDLLNPMHHGREGIQEKYYLILHQSLLDIRQLVIKIDIFLVFSGSVMWAGQHFHRRMLVECHSVVHVLSALRIFSRILIRHVQSMVVHGVRTLDGSSWVDRW